MSKYHKNTYIKSMNFQNSFISKIVGSQNVTFFLRKEMVRIAHRGAV